MSFFYYDVRCMTHGCQGPHMIPPRIMRHDPTQNHDGIPKSSSATVSSSGSHAAGYTCSLPEASIMQ